VGGGASLDVGAIVAIYAPKTAQKLPAHERGVIRHLFTVVRPTHLAEPGMAWRNVVFLGQRVSLRQAVTLEELKNETVTAVWKLPKTNFKAVGSLKQPLSQRERPVFWRVIANRNDLRDLAGLLDIGATIPTLAPAKREYAFDIAISFAGEDRVVARRLAVALRDAGLKVFFDEFAAAELFGADLYVKLAEIYEKNARFCMPVPIYQLCSESVDAA
jgi:hypothetical protein